MSARKLDKFELLSLLGLLMNPKKNGLTQQELDQVLIDFCAGCPDPIKARWLIVECLDPLTDEEIVDHALSTPFREMSDVPLAITPRSHPARLEGN
jgi:hypothetical protein